jgi:hypothetical protein
MIALMLIVIVAIVALGVLVDDAAAQTSTPTPTETPTPTPDLSIYKEVSPGVYGKIELSATIGEIAVALAISIVILGQVLGLLFNLVTTYLR